MEIKYIYPCLMVAVESKCNANLKLNNVKVVWFAFEVTLLVSCTVCTLCSFFSKERFTWNLRFLAATAKKAIFLVLVRIFPQSDWIRRDTGYLSVFSQNAGKNNSEYGHFSRSEVSMSIETEIANTCILIFCQESLTDIP